MILTETTLKGVFVIDLELRSDHRGFFARSFCAKEFQAHGLKPTVVQCNLSFNHKKGTVRGMHYQCSPAAETKLVRCTKGAIYDVVIDLRPESATYKFYFGVELTAENRRALYIPEGLAHGFQTLVDETEVAYQMGDFYTPAYDRGLRYDDPTFKIPWRLPVSEISERDLSLPCFDAAFSHESLMTK